MEKYLQPPPLGAEAVWWGRGNMKKRMRKKEKVKEEGRNWQGKRKWNVPERLSYSILKKKEGNKG
jgi:hypothetical protein